MAAAATRGDLSGVKTAAAFVVRFVAVSAFVAIEASTMSMVGNDDDTVQEDGEADKEEDEEKTGGE